jgi:hypothetical protein
MSSDHDREESNEGQETKKLGPLEHSSSEALQSRPYRIQQEMKLDVPTPVLSSFRKAP